MGEPPAPFHPVVWMGRILGWLETRAPPCSRARFRFGAVVALANPMLWAAVGWLVERLSPWPVCAVLLKASFSGRALLSAAARVENALETGRLVEARQQLMHLVSRPTAELSPSLVAAAAIESLTENLVDSWVAPLAAYACFGLAGACAYRATNTADAMWGYQDPEYEWLGKVAARLDDLLTLLPARLGAAVLVLSGSRACESVAVWRRDAARTPSPNAGQPMAAAAGQLGIRLEKPGHYVLNAAAPAPCVEHLAAARALVGRAMLLTGLLALAARHARA